MEGRGDGEKWTLSLHEGVTEAFPNTSENISQKVVKSVGRPGWRMHSREESCRKDTEDGRCARSSRSFDVRDEEGRRDWRGRQSPDVPELTWKTEELTHIYT